MSDGWWVGSALYVWVTRQNQVAMSLTQQIV